MTIVFLAWMLMSSWKEFHTVKEWFMKKGFSEKTATNAGWTAVFGWMALARAVEYVVFH